MEEWMVFVAWSAYYVKKESVDTPLKFIPDFIQVGSLDSGWH